MKNEVGEMFIPEWFDWNKITEGWKI
jgi:hypothetical protein